VKFPEADLSVDQAPWRRIAAATDFNL